MFVPQSGYDRAITVFSPDGRLFQVEYALETVKRGTLSVGAVNSEGILLAAEENINKYQVEEFSRKVFILDDHLGVAVAGYVPDGRILIDYSREYCQSHRLTYDEAADVELVARRVSDIKQAYTQNGGVRPFGVSIIFGGIDGDDTPKVYVTDPSGSYMGYTLAVIGNRADAALEFLDKKYNTNLSMEETKILLAGAIGKTKASTEKTNIRFLEIDIKNKSSKLRTIIDSSKYIQKAKDSFGE